MDIEEFSVFVKVNKHTHITLPIIKKYLILQKDCMSCKK